MIRNTTINDFKCLGFHGSWTCIAFLLSMLLCSQAMAGGGPIAHDIDFDFTEFSVTGTKRLPFGHNEQLVETRITFELNRDSGGEGNTIIREDGDGDLILELGENTFVESEFSIAFDISFEDIDPTFNFAEFAGGTVLFFENVGMSFVDNTFVAQCDVGFGAFGGCGVLMDTDDYDLEFPNESLLLGIDVNNDTVDDQIDTFIDPGSNEDNVPGIEIDFGDNPDTTIIEGEVVQDYVVELDWLFDINPEEEASLLSSGAENELLLVGTASIVTTADPASVVPVPAAVWMFMSAFGVLLGARRKFA